MTLLYFRPFFFSFGDYLVFMLPSISVKRDLTTFFSIFPPQWLRKKWSQVKRKAPNYHLLEFEGMF